MFLGSDSPGEKKGGWEDRKAAKIALAGVTLAVSLILMILGSVVESSTLFFLAAGAFCIGIVIRESGIGAGAAFGAASLLSGFFLSPNKLYLLPYGLMEWYVLLREWLWVCLEKKQADGRKNVKNLYWLGKYVMFQLLMIPILIFVRKGFFLDSNFTGIVIANVQIPLVLVAELAGIVFWLLLDMAYDVFQRQFWGQIRNRLKKE